MQHPTSRTYVLMALPRRLDELESAVPSPNGELLPIFVGGGGDNLLCGECFFMLAQFVELENLKGRKLICPRCARENVIPMVGDLRALGHEPATPDESASRLVARPAMEGADLPLDSGRVGSGEGAGVNL